MKFLSSFLLVALVSALHAAEPAAPITWRSWSPDVFAEAKRDNKFVLLDLEAVWCHWCHVMDETTYRDPRVGALIASRYLCVRVDQDSRPDLANRYEDWGWPATIIFGSDGKEIVKKQGYITPDGMTRLLQAVIDDPSPVDYGDTPAAAVASDGALSAPRRAALRQRLLEGYDPTQGGWGTAHKYLEWDTAEFALREAARGDATAEKMVRDALRLHRTHLLDPVWGGIYQYSAAGVWTEPHFEKLLQFQAENIRLFALAHAQFGDPADLAAAHAVRDYVAKFLTSPERAFYVSQDADLVPGEHSADYFALDDAARRARGIPRVDRHLYARENGWMIAALCQLAAVEGEASAKPAHARPLEDAIRAARWVIAHRSLPGGGFAHDERDAAGPFLGDTLAMGRAFLALHELTQEPEWLERAAAAGEFIRRHFARGAEPGFASSDTTKETMPAPRPQFDENVGLTRFATALAHTTGRGEFRAVAAAGLRWLLGGELAERRGFYVGGLLLAESETRTEPVHVTIVGGKNDPTAQALFTAALRLPSTHRLIEWWDPRSGPPPRGEAIYPSLEKPAAFLCANGACSSPLFSPEALAARLAKSAPR